MDGFRLMKQGERYEVQHVHGERDSTHMRQGGNRCPKMFHDPPKHGHTGHGCDEKRSVGWEERERRVACWKRPSLSRSLTLNENDR